MCQPILTISKGVLTAKASGVTYVTVKYKGKTSNKVKITVTQTRLSKTSVKLAGGKTYKLTAKYNGKTVKPSYKSSNTKIATVDKNGKITAVAKGSATITATYKGSKASCKVTVTSTPLKLSKTNVSLAGGKTYTLTAKYNGKTVKPSYKSSNTKIATVDKNGKITAVAKGSATITASYKGTIVTCKVTVTSNAHTHKYTATVTTKATCTKDGIKTYKCSCGKTYTEKLPATGHKYVVTNHFDATCGEAGRTDYKCERCGDTYFEMIPPTQKHNLITETKEPTCTENGYTFTKCTNCADQHKHILEATGHSYDDGIVTKEPTANTDGIITYTCEKCKDTFTEIIPATGSDNDNNNQTPIEPTEPEPPTCEHEWVEVTETVHHDEVGHYETIVIEEAYDKPVYESGHVICGGCGKDFGIGNDAVEAWSDHCWDQIDAGITTCQNYHTEKVQIDTIHHNAVTEQKWIVDTPAYDETVITGYECKKCGQTKSN